MIEILIAIGVAVIALLSISRITSRSIINTGSASRQSTAINYAQTAVDMVRNTKNALGLAGKTSPSLANGTWCFNGTAVDTATSGYCQINLEYQGRVTFTHTTINLKDELTVLAEVQWVEGNLTRTVKNEAKMVFDQ